MSVSDDKGTEGNQPYAQPVADQVERRAILRQDQGARTYFEMAQGDEADSRGRTPVTGANPPPFVAPQWSRDLASLPKEPPLGEDINAVNDTEACWWQPDAVRPRGQRTDQSNPNQPEEADDAQA